MVNSASFGIGVKQEMNMTKLSKIIILLTFTIQSIGINHSLSAIRYSLDADKTLRPMSHARTINPDAVLEVSGTLYGGSGQEILDIRFGAYVQAFSHYHRVEGRSGATAVDAALDKVVRAKRGLLLVSTLRQIRSLEEARDGELVYFKSTETISKYDSGNHSSLSDLPQGEIFVLDPLVETAQASSRGKTSSPGQADYLEKGRLRILVEEGIGANLGDGTTYTDAAYEAAGADLTDRESVWKRADIVLKVKEPLIEGGINEFELMKAMGTAKLPEDSGHLVIGVVREIKPDESRAALLPDGVERLLAYSAEHGCVFGDLKNTLFTYYHFATSEEMTERVLETGVNAIALEAIRENADDAAYFKRDDWVDSEGEPGRVVIPEIVRYLKQLRGETLSCLDPMSVNAGIKAVLDGVVYLKAERRDRRDGRVHVDSNWADRVRNSFPDCPIPNALKGYTTFITGAGTSGLSSLSMAESLGSKVIISDVGEKISLVFDILRKRYNLPNAQPDPKLRVARAFQGRNLDDLLEQYDIIIIDGSDSDLVQNAMAYSQLWIGAVLVEGGRGEAPKTMPREAIKYARQEEFRRRWPMVVAVDIAVDQKGTIVYVNPDGNPVEVDPLYHSDDARIGYKGVIDIRVANMPGLKGNTALSSSRALQESRLVHVESLVSMGFLKSAETPSLRAGISAVSGRLVDEVVSGLTGFGDLAFADIAAALTDYELQLKASSAATNTLSAPTDTDVEAAEKIFSSRYLVHCMAIDALLQAEERHNNKGIIQGMNKVAWAWQRLWLESKKVKVRSLSILRKGDKLCNVVTKEIIPFKGRSRLGGRARKLLEAEIRKGNIVRLDPLVLRAEDRRLRDELVKQLSDRSERLRIKAASQLKQMEEEGRIPRPYQINDIFQHCHTKFSYAPDYPAGVAWTGYQLGLLSTGLVDHFTMAGEREFLTVAERIGLRNPTVNLEARVDFSGTDLDGLVINSPGNPNEGYLEIHGLKDEDLDLFRKTVVPAVVRRFKRTIRHINKEGNGIQLSYERDVKPLAEVIDPETGLRNTTERHLSEAIAEKILKLKKQKGWMSPSKAMRAVNYTKRFIEACIGEKIELSKGLVKAILEDNRDNLVVAIRDTLVTPLRKRFPPTSQENLPVQVVIDYVHAHGGTIHYLYLGDLKGCEAERRDNGQLRKTFRCCKELGIDGIGFMPNRNTDEEIAEVLQIAKEEGFTFLFNGMDVNKYGQPYTFFFYSCRKDFVRRALALAREEVTKRLAKASIADNREVTPEQSLYISGAINMLLSANASHRRNAVKDIAKLREPLLSEALARIEALLSDDSRVVREAAAWALGELGCGKSMRALNKAQRDDKDGDVRKAAGEAIRKIMAFKAHLAGKVTTKIKRKIAKAISKAYKEGQHNIRLSVREDNFVYFVDDQDMIIKVVDLDDIRDTADSPYLQNHVLLYQEHIRQKQEQRVKLERSPKAKLPNIPDINVIMQSKQPAIQQLIYEGKALPAMHPDFVAVLKEKEELLLVPVTSREKMRREMVEAIGKHNIILTQLDGVISVGANLTEAQYRNMLVEDSARTFLAAELMGKVKHLTIKQAEKLLRTRYEKYRQRELAQADTGSQKKEFKTIKIAGVERYKSVITRRRNELVKQGRRIARRRLVVGPGGNNSAIIWGTDARGKEIGIVLIKASGKAFESMGAEDYVAVDLATGHVIEGLGKMQKPSTETIFHRATYKKRRDVSAICHAHPPIATGIATSGYTFEFNGEDVAWIGYVHPGGVEIARRVSEALLEKDALLMARHGAVTLGKNITEAVDSTIALEKEAMRVVAQEEADKGLRSAKIPKRQLRHVSAKKIYEALSVKSSSAGNFIRECMDSDDPAINPSLTTLIDLLKKKDTGLEEFLQRARWAQEAGAKSLHIDIFDENYVDTGGKGSNIGIFTPQVVQALSKVVTIPIDVHLMVRPSTIGELKLYPSAHGSLEAMTSYVVDLSNSGASSISLHIGAFNQDITAGKMSESDGLKRTLGAIRSIGAYAGVAINPDEGSQVFQLLMLEDDIDFAGPMMTVIPGAGGRGFDNRGLENIKELRRLGFRKLIAADGGVTDKNIAEVVEVGAKWLVVGSHFFGKGENLKSRDQIMDTQTGLISAAKTSSAAKGGVNKALKAGGKDASFAAPEAMHKRRQEVKGSLAEAMRFIASKKPEGKILVTGGAGYVGSVTSAILLMVGYDVVIVDNFVKGRMFVVKALRRLAKKLGRKCMLERGSITDRKFVQRVCQKHKDSKALMHFAAYAEVGESMDLPALYFENNIIGTLNLLDEAGKAGIPMARFASSAATYGPPNQMPIPETHPTNPINAYGYSKLTMERTIGFFAKKFKMNWGGFRFFNAAGALIDEYIPKDLIREIFGVDLTDFIINFGENHDPESHLMPLAIRRFEEGKKLQAYGADWDTRDGTCIRDYVSVVDIAIIHILSLFASEEVLNRAYNVGSGEGYTVKEVGEIIYLLMHPDASQDDVKDSWAPTPRRPGDPERLLADGAALKENLGFSPTPASDIENLSDSAIRYHRLKPEEAFTKTPTPERVESEVARGVMEDIEYFRGVIPDGMSDEILEEFRKYTALAEKRMQDRHGKVLDNLRRIGKADLLDGWSSLTTFQQRDRLLKEAEGLIRREEAKISANQIELIKGINSAA